MGKVENAANRHQRRALASLARNGLHLNWSEERYVRIFTRDTVNLRIMCWQARAIIWEIFRKLDRAGVLVLGRAGLKGLSVLINMPLEVVELGMRDLRKQGVFRLTHGGTILVSPNFIEAQEAPQNDAARARTYREKRRDIAAAMARGILVEDVTIRDEVVTNPDADVTPTSRGVTLSRAVPNQPKKQPRERGALSDSEIVVREGMECPTEFASVVEDVQQRRGGVVLPPPEELWEKFSNVHDGRAYATRKLLRNAFRRFALNERPITVPPNSRSLAVVSKPEQEQKRVEDAATTIEAQRKREREDRPFRELTPDQRAELARKQRAELPEILRPDIRKAVNA